MGRGANAPKRAKQKRSWGETAFRGHLKVFLVFALFFLSLNLLTGPGEWWWYWPVFFWGWALVFQALATFGAAAPARVWAILQSMVPAAARAATGGGRPSAGAAGPAPESLTDEAEERVARLWRVARRIPSEAARQQAFRVCVAADRVAEALVERSADAPTVQWFIDCYLKPTETLLDRYERVARRVDREAEPALTKVERESLPLVESRLDSLYQQLHRGDVIDLAVATDMLEFDLPESLPRPSRA